MAAALKSVQGVQDVKLNSDSSEATVTLKATSKDADLVAAVKKQGYGAWVIPTKTVQLAVTGLACGGCEKKADAAIRTVTGMRKVKVNKTSKRATITFEIKRATTTKIVKALKKAGFASREVTS